MNPAEVALVLAATGGPAAIAAVAVGTEQRHNLSVHLLALVALCVLTFACFSLSGMAFKSPTWITPVLGLAMAAGIIFVLGPFLLWLAAQASSEGHFRGLSQLQGLPVWSVGLAIGVGAICEELLYRGVAWPILSASLGALLAAFVVSFAFGLAHWPLWGRGPALSTAVAGLAFTASYAAHGDLYANMLAHALADFIALVLPRLTACEQRTNGRPQ